MGIRTTKQKPDKRVERVNNELVKFLEDYFYYRYGYNNINGGFTNVKLDSVKRRNRNEYIVNGWLTSGTVDCGDGHSETFTDILSDVELVREKGKVYFKENGGNKNDN